MAGVFVIAEEETVLAFRMAGADGRAVSSREEAIEAFREATGPNRGESGPKVLILAEEVADMIGEEALRWQEGGGFPLVAELPGRGMPRPGRKGLADLVREAIGVSV